MERLRIGRSASKLFWRRVAKSRRALSLAPMRCDSRFRPPRAAGLGANQTTVVKHNFAQQHGRVLASLDVWFHRAVEVHRLCKPRVILPLRMLI
jgi:hypothetical protein